MKTYKYTLLIFTVIALSTMVGCKSDGNDPVPIDPLAEQTELLMNEGSAWVLSGGGSVVKDGFDVISQFAGFTLTIGKNTYTTTNGLSSAWPASGTWDFENGNASKIRRSDGVLITAAVTTSTLQLTFIAGGNAGGRISGIEGEYQFNLVKQ